LLLEGFKSGRLSIIGGDRGLGATSLARRRGIMFHPGIIRKCGGFRSGAVEWVGKGVSTPPPTAPLCTRHQRVGWMDSIDRDDKIRNRRE